MIAWIVAAAVAVRLGLQAVGLVATAGDGPWTERAIDLWQQWDANHYLRLAEVGYRPTGEDGLLIVVLPLYPLVVRAVALVVGNLVVSGMLVSFVATIGAAWFLYRLVLLDAAPEVAWRSVVLMLAFPTAYFLSAPYTEALFLWSVLGCVYAARVGAWGRSALAGTAATATRIAGGAIFVPLAFEAVRGRPGRADILRRMVFVALAGCGFLAYLALNQLVHGSPTAFIEIQRSHWHNQLTWPWTPLVEAVAGLVKGAPSSDFAIVFWGRLIGFASAASVLWFGRKRLRGADQAYGWAGLVLLLCSTWLISFPRYLLALYPLFIAGAWLLRNPIVFWSVSASGMVVQVLFFWRYATGQWTF